MLNIVVMINKQEDKLENLLLNLINQTEKDIRIILVNNGQKKKTQNICKFYCKKYDNIKLAELTYYNYKIAKEKALELCKGEYTIFIQENIIIDKNFVKNLLKENNNYDIIIYNNKNSNFEIKKFLENENDNSIYNKLIKTNLLKKINMEKSLQTFDYIYRLMLLTNNIKIIQSDIFKNIEINEIEKDEIEILYQKFVFYNNQFKELNDLALKNIALNKMIKYGNKAYINMILNKNQYKNKLNNIKSTYLFLKTSEYKIKEKKLFEKIKNNKIDVDSIYTQKIEIINKIKNKIKKEQKI